MPWRDERARDHDSDRGHGSGHERACGRCLWHGHVCGGDHGHQCGCGWGHDESGTWCDHVRGRVFGLGRG
ncbi:hypothetical protein, partial [Acinetobacter nosocomialis]|uniref:hypothetical protein n=1 Tax=Acinetobacter nosocomialis TaxID=106654 RepID=UPI00196B864A